MRNRLLIVFLSLLPAILHSENLTLTGKIVDKKGEVIFPATVVVVSDYSIGTCDEASGNFSLTLPNTYLDDTMLISFIGYESHKIAVKDLLQGENTIVLSEASQLLDDIIVVSNPSISREFAVRELSAMDIYMTPGAGADPLRAISMLAVSTDRNESATPKLRGSDGNFSRILLNDVPIYKPMRNASFTNTGSFSLFNTAMIETMTIYPDNPPLKFSNSVAGCVDIHTQSTLPYNQKLSAGLSLGAVAVAYDRKVSKKSFLQTFANYQFSPLYIGLNKCFIHDTHAFSSADIGVNWRTNFTKHLYLNIYSYFVYADAAFNFYLLNTKDSATSYNKRFFTVVNLCYKKKNWSLSLNHGTNLARPAFSRPKPSVE